MNQKRYYKYVFCVCGAVNFRYALGADADQSVKDVADGSARGEARADALPSRPAAQLARVYKKCVAFLDESTAQALRT